MNKLKITKAQFDEFYPGLKLYSYIFWKEFETDKQFIEEYLSSKLWRLNNLYSIINKNGEAISFVMNWSQHKVYAAHLEHPRLIILKSRQQGISTLWLISMFDDAIFEENINVGLMAQGADETQTLLERVKFTWDNLDVSIKNHLGIANDKDNAKAFSFTNNSTIFIRTSFRSATLQRLHVSELGKIANKYPEKAKETNTGTLQAISAGNTVILESTAEGENMFSIKWDKAYGHEGPHAPKDFKAVFLPWWQDPDCVSDVKEYQSPEIKKYFDELEQVIGVEITVKQRNFWIMQKRELDDSGKDADIFQEYPATPEEAFAGKREGAYYIKQYNTHIRGKDRLIENLFDSNLVVDVVMDLGMNDDFVLGFWQFYNMQERLVHEYKNSGEGLEHYTNYMFKWAEEHGATIDWTICPHDIKVRDLSAEGGITRKQRLRELGVTRIQVVDKSRINAGIEAVRRMIPNVYIDKSCEYVDKCLKNYSKEYDDKILTWKDKPLHNEWSHGADMVRMRAMSKSQYKLAVDKKRGRKRSTVVDGLDI